MVRVSALCPECGEFREIELVKAYRQTIRQTARPCAKCAAKLRHQQKIRDAKKMLVKDVPHAKICKMLGLAPRVLAGIIKEMS